MNYDPDQNYFRKLDQQIPGPIGEVVVTGRVPAWQCRCYHWNGVNVDRCNNCGDPKPCMALVAPSQVHPQLKSLREVQSELEAMR